MKTTVTGKIVTTTLTKADEAKLVRVLERLGPQIKSVSVRGRLSPDEAWHQLVGQVCVMGSATGMDRIGKDKAERDRFRRATSLRAWRKADFEVAYMVSALKEFRATRFRKKAAKRLRRIATNSEVVKGTRVVLLKRLPRSRDPDVVREELLRRCPEFKEKSVSDYMITMRVSRDVIALDVRVVGALREYLGFNLLAGRVQANKRIYRSVEQALRGVCEQAGFKLALLDRTLFRFKGKNELDDAMKVKPRRR